MDLAIRWMLIVTGGFYVFAAVVTLKAVLMHAAIDKALTGISGEPAEMLDRWQRVWLGSGSALIGLGGLMLAFALNTAMPVFVCCALAQALYLFWLAPTYFDRKEAPDPKGRRQSWWAFGWYTLVTALVLAAWQRGLLRGWAQIPVLEQTLLVLCVLVSALWLGRKIWLVAAMNKTAADPESDVYEDSQQEPPLKPLPDKIRLTPSWNQGMLFDAETGEPIEQAYERLGLDESVVALLEDWHCLFVDLSDARDPWRCALDNPADSERLRQGGLAARQALEQALGAERLVFDPVAKPVPARIAVDDLIFRADYQCWALWFGPQADAVGDIKPDDLGLSWGLSREIEQWGLEFEESIDLNDPGNAAGQPARWTAQAYTDHNRRGAELLEKIRAEMVLTGRAHVRLVFEPTTVPNEKTA